MSKLFEYCNYGFSFHALSITSGARARYARA